MKFTIGFWLALAAVVQAGKLDFPKVLKEVEAAPDASTVTTDFPFTNKSDKPVTITKSDPSCSCLKVEISGGKMTYAPGESGVIRTVFEMGNFSGTVDKSVRVCLDNDSEDKPSITLTTRVQVPVLVSIEPKTVKWELNGKAEPQTVHLTMADGQTIHVLSAKSSNPSFALNILKVEDGKKYDLVITPSDIGVPGIGVVRIETDCAITRHKIQNAFAIIRKPTAAEEAHNP